MPIPYSKFHRWYKPVVEEPETLFSKKNRKRIISTLNRIDEHDISHTFTPLDDAFLSWFTPLYTETVGSKQNAVVHDIRGATLGNHDSPSEYWGLTLTEHGRPIGGTIFGMRDEKLMTVFKTYPYKWAEGSLQANPTLYSEYLLCRHAFETGKGWISHGKDRNPYGPNAAIGLATFKLSVGYQASILEAGEGYERELFDETDLAEDALLLHYPESGEEITAATLFTSTATEEKYAQLTSYPELLTISVRLRDS